MRGEVGWGLVAGVVAGWDFFADETLSAAFLRGLDNKYSRPFVLGALALTGAHLTGMLPEPYDPFKFLLSFKTEKYFTATDHQL